SWGLTVLNRELLRRLSLTGVRGIGAGCCLAASLWAVEPSSAPSETPAAEPKAVAASNADSLLVQEKSTAEGLAVVERALVALQGIKDYSCVFVKRETVNGRQQPQQYMFMKLRREPFSVYLHFLRPDDRQGQEAIYLHGARDNKLLAHGVGWQKRIGGTRALEPTSSLAMSGNRHPITEIGMENLVRIVSGLPQTEPGFASIRTRFFPDRYVAGRKCLGVEFAHTQPVEGATFLAMRLYFDEETALPLRQELWQRGADGQPELSEEYTYADVKINRGYKDRDFDPQNPAYDYD
ncbi:MAG TPA: DUF1571 domain-containing protein, partial [Pirellulales bacterium]